MRSLHLKIHAVSLLLAALMVLMPERGFADRMTKVPEKLQAAIFIKVLSMSKEISGKETVVIHVTGDATAAAELRKAVGLKIGDATLTAVHEGPELPADPPNVLYINEGDNVGALIRYCREHHVLSMTGNPDLVGKGVTLGVGLSGNKPRILLNAAASNEEKITWSAVLLKISSIVTEEHGLGS